jgi:hypothetical protein
MNVNTALRGRELRMVTVTLKSSDQGLGEQITRLTKSFASLRRQPLIRKRMTGGLYFLEITLNPATQQWHPHLHCLFEGSYIPHQQLSDLWLQVTGDSFIVDIKAFRNVAAAAGYVAKYASKGLSQAVLTNHERLTEAVLALFGKRTFQTFGSFKNLGLSKPPADDCEWEIVGSLSHLLMRAKAGDAFALQIIKSLRASNVDEPGNVHCRDEQRDLLSDLRNADPPE